MKKEKNCGFKTTKQNSILSVFLIFCLIFSIIIHMPVKAYAHDNNNGEWSRKNVVMYDTEEADLMVRVGDIDNFGFGWENKFNPFSGDDTSVHAFPWTTPSDEPNGLDRIMVVSGYKYNSEKVSDGYTKETSRISNTVKSIDLNYKSQLNYINVNNAVLQMFVDDFQPGNAHGIPNGNVNYTVTLNGTRIPELAAMINSLDQSGPRGRMITFRIPDKYLSLVKSGNLSLKIDDNTKFITGDGYAIDFVKLLINVRKLSNTATIKGKVTDLDGNRPISQVNVSAGGVVTAITNNRGEYILREVPAGQAIIAVSKDGYESKSQAINISAGDIKTLDFCINEARKPATPVINITPMTITSGSVNISVEYPENPIKREIYYDGKWMPYTGPVKINDNQEVKAKSISRNGISSDEASMYVGNIINPSLQASRTPNKVETIIGKDINLKYEVIPQDISGVNPDIFNKSDKDIVLVMDTSPSMDFSMAGGGTRLAAAKASAKTFINNFEGDNKANISLVTFSESAYINNNFINMSNNKPKYTSGVLQDKIDNLKTHSGTNIGDGLRYAYYLLKNSPRENSKKYIVLMTDGLANFYSYSSESYFQVNYVQDDRVSNYYVGGSDEYPQNGIEYSNLMANLIKRNKEQYDINSFMIGFFPNRIQDNADIKLKEVARRAEGTYKEAKTADDMNDVYAKIADNINCDFQIDGGVFTQILPDGLVVEEAALPNGFTVKDGIITGSLDPLSYKWDYNSNKFVCNNKPSFNIKFRANKKGNYNLTGDSKIKYDNINEVLFNPVTLNVSELLTQPILKPDINIPTNNDVKVTISNWGNAKIREYVFMYDNEKWSDWITYDNTPINMRSNGVIQAIGRDDLGNTSPIGILQITNIDKTPPTGIISINSSAERKVTLTIKASDIGSGVKRIQKPDKNWAIGDTTTYEVASNGEYAFVVEDNAGNQQSVNCKVNNIAYNVPKISIKITDKVGDRDEYKEQGNLNIESRIDKILNSAIILKGNAAAQIKITDEQLKNVKYKFVETPVMPKDGQLITINDSIKQQVVYPDLVKDKVGYLTSRNYNVSSLPVKNNEKIWNNKSQVFAKPSSIIEYRSANCANSVDEYISKIDDKFKNYTIFMNYLDLGNKGPYPEYKEAAKFWGYITPPETNDYYFGTKSDDGSQGYIIVDGNKIQIVDQFKIQGSTFKTNNNRIYLEKGKYYPIYLEYSNWGGDGEFRLLYKNTKFNSYNDQTGGITVPADWFSPSSNTNPGEVSTATFESTAVAGIPFPEQTGNYYIAFKAENEAGGVREGIYGPFLVDKTLPTGTITKSIDTMTNEDITLTFVGSDVGSGVEKVQKPDGTWVNSDTTSVTVSKNGSYIFQVEDKAGNKADITIEVKNIDKTPSIVVNKGIFLNEKLIDSDINIVRSFNANIGIGIKTIFDGQDVKLQINKDSNNVQIEGNAFDLYEVTNETDFIIKEISKGIVGTVKKEPQEEGKTQKEMIQEFTIPMTTASKGYKYYLIVFKLNINRESKVETVAGNKLKINSQIVKDDKGEPFEFIFNVKDLPPLE